MTATTSAADIGSHTFVDPESTTQRTKRFVFNIGVFANRTVRRTLAYSSTAVTIAMIFAIPYAVYVGLAMLTQLAFAAAPALGWALITLMAASAISTLFRLRHVGRNVRVAFSV